MDGTIGHSLSPQAESVFVGREREMTMLRTALEDTLSGRGRMLLLVGEPGIGKTRLASKLAAEARQRGAQVLVGRGYEGEGAPSFWPWLQIIRAYATDCELETLRAEMGAGAADIAHMIPEVRTWLPEVPVPSALESEQTRFCSFDSFTAFLKNAARRQPHMLILDDLHWADIPSLLLLQFVVREVGSSRLLIVGTHRDLVLGRTHPLARALGEIVRESCSQSVALQGLSEDDVARFIEGTTAQLPSAALVASVHKTTEGNPFFLTEVVRLLFAAGSQSIIPGSRSGIVVPLGVRAAIDRRLLELSAECQQVLTLAAVIGREFDVAVLAGIRAGVKPAPVSDWLLELLEEAVAMRIIAEVPRTVGRYNFSHALIREVLYEELSAARRVRLHRQIAEVLERLSTAKQEAHLSTSSGQVLAELAYHFFQAVPGGGDVNKAIAYSSQAGEYAMAALAYEDAVLHYQRALQALDFGEADEFQRCELLLSLGAAQRKAGDISTARDIFQQVAALARTLGAGQRRPQAAALLARAALGFGGEAWVEYGATDEPLVVLLEEALSLVDLDDSVLRARLLGRLAVELFHLTRDRERRDALSQQALEMARRVGDTATLAYALTSRHHALWGNTQTEERLAIATEIIHLAHIVGARELAMIGHAWRVADLLEWGEITAADTEIEEFTRLAAELRQPLYQWWALLFRTMRAFLVGRFAEVEQLALQALTIGQHVHPQAAVLLFGVQRFAVLRQQGRFEELEAAVRQWSTPQLMAMREWHVSMALLHSERGCEVEARQELTALVTNDSAVLLRDENWQFNLVSLAQVCSFLGDRQRAAILYEALRPYVGRTIVVGNISAAICLGSVSRALGLLATTLSRWEEAEAYFIDALGMNIRLGARPFVAHTQHDYAWMLLTRAQPGDRAKALELLHVALVTARELGMKSLEDKIQSKCQSLKSTVQEDEKQKTKGKRQKTESTPQLSASRPQTLDVSFRPSALGLRPADSAPNVFRREGTYWTLAYQGTICRLKDAKGLHYLALLLRSPEREFHVVDLAAITTPEPTVFPTPSVRKRVVESLAAQQLHVAGPGHAGDKLDAQAKTAYQRRLEDLRDELREAERFHDLARADKAQTEIDFISRELAAAYGLGGRTRKSASDSEKVRQAVGYCIRSSLNKIRTTHPALWRHLCAALKTGTFCSYNPERPTTWEL